MRDLMNNVHPAGANVAAPADTTPVVSGIVDVQGFDSLTFLILTGTLADIDATFTVLVEHDDDIGFGAAAAVPDDELIGTEALAGFTFALDQGARKIGYKGAKRYVRCTVTPVANASAAPIGVVGLLGHPHHAPTDNPPA